MRLLQSALALIFLWVAPALSALEVRQFVWGYDNQVVPGTFNLLSVLVANPSEGTFDGQIELAVGDGAGPRGGERAVAPCYLAPGAARWVQFYPFFDNSNASGNAGWVLAWGRGQRDRFELDPPKLGPPARVSLADPDEFAPREVPRLRRFPENLFPPTVSATDGLATAVLDHVPRWEAARRGAFLDWVRRGGIVHLIPDEAGHEVQFTDELAALNSPLDQQRVGGGMVVRHHGAADGSKEDLFKDDPAPPTLEKGGDQATVYDLEDDFFRQLARLVAPHVSWTLIYWLTALYLAAVGPLHYLWARKRRSYGWSLAVFAGGVALFALAFGWVGRRGRGETGQVTTLAWARPLGDGARCDVTQWSNAFVTRGGSYALTHPSPYNLYSGKGTAEEFAGRALCGLSGRYLVDLPLFSSCAVIHRGVMAGDPLPVDWTGAQTADGKLKSLALPLPGGFPAGRFRQAFVRFHGQFYPLRMGKDGAALELAGDPEDAKDFFAASELNNAKVYYDYGREEAGGSVPAKLIFDHCERALLARSVGGTDGFVRYLKIAPPPDGQAELFLLMDGQPAAFQMAGAGGGRETAMVLYQRTLFKP